MIQKLYILRVPDASPGVTFTFAACPEMLSILK